MRKVKQNSKAKQIQKVKQSVKQNSRSAGTSVKGSKTSYESGVPGGTRTHNPLLRRQMLYPLSYRDNPIDIISFLDCPYITEKAEPQSTMY